MRCVLCKTRFYDLSWSSPAEPCDCGENLTAESAREMTDEEFHDAEARSKAVLAGDDDDTTRDAPVCAWCGAKNPEAREGRDNDWYCPGCPDED